MLHFWHMVQENSILCHHILLIEYMVKKKAVGILLAYKTTQKTITLIKLIEV